MLTPAAHPLHTLDADLLLDAGAAAAADKSNAGDLAVNQKVQEEQVKDVKGRVEARFLLSGSRIISGFNPPAKDNMKEHDMHNP